MYLNDTQNLFVMKVRIERTEKLALIVGVIANMFMAISGWFTYYLTHSEAMLLDGNFSFISSLACLVALLISKRKHIRSKLFPLGNYMHEAFFVLFKGILILGVILAACFQNVLKIIEFFSGKDVGHIEVGPILIYTLAMMLICFGLAYFYSKNNKFINNSSSMLNVESKSAIIDGFLSFAVGMALLLISLIPMDSALGFFHSIGDALIVLTLCGFLIKTPLKVIRGAVIELGGGVLQDVNELSFIEDIIKTSLLKDYFCKDSYISKMGSSYVVIAYVSTSKTSVLVEDINVMKTSMYSSLLKKLPVVELEVVISK